MTEHEAKSEVLAAIEEIERERQDFRERVQDEWEEIDSRMRDLLVKARALGLRPKDVAEALSAAHRDEDENPEAGGVYSYRGAANMMRDADEIANYQIGHIVRQLTKDPDWEPESEDDE